MDVEGWSEVTAGVGCDLRTFEASFCLKDVRNASMTLDNSSPLITAGCAGVDVGDSLNSTEDPVVP